MSPKLLSRRGAIGASSEVASVSYPASYYTGPLGANNILPAKEGMFLFAQHGGPVLATWENTQAFIDQRETDMGRSYDGIHLNYWGGGTLTGGMFGLLQSEMNDNREQWVNNRGAHCLVSWSPDYTIDQVNAGVADSIFTYYANRVKNYGFPIMLRLWWEFNNPAGFSWCVGETSDIGANFITAWRRVVGLFEAAGADNVGFWWCPMEGSDRVGQEASYPGDAYVDWVGSDAYTGCYASETSCYTGYAGPGWASFAQLTLWTGMPHQNALKLYGDGVIATKPFVYGEVGCVSDPARPDLRAAWFPALVASLKNNPGNKAIGVSFFDQDVSPLEGPRTNWRVDNPIGSPEVYAGFKTMANDPWFNTKTNLTNRERLGLSMWKAPYGDSAVDFSSAITETGAGFVRVDFAGSVIRPNSGTWNWSLADLVVGRANAAGVKILASCAYCPSWMNGSYANDKRPPLDAYFTQYAAIAAEVENRYGSSLIGIETWNEPWLTTNTTDGAFWLPIMEPARFLALSKAQAQAVWAINPNRDIAVCLDYWGQGLNAGQRFDSAVVAADTTDFLLDPRVVLATHNYSESASPQTVRGTGWSFDRWKLARLISGNYRVWVTEFGWTANPGEVSESTQAMYTTDGINMMLADGVERVVWFGVAFAGADGNWGYNLRRSDGSWRPATAAFKAIADAPREITTPPIAPGTGYSVPSGANVATTDAQLRTLLNQAASTIVYSGPPTTATIELDGHKLYADTALGRTLNAGVSMTGNGSELHGFNVIVADVAHAFQSDCVNIWGPNAKVMDCVFTGAGLLENGVRSEYGILNLVVERCEASNFRHAGFYLCPATAYKVADGAACDAIAHISDLYAHDIHWSSPGASGVSEAGVWIGAPVTNGVQRILTERCGRKGIETSVNARDTVFDHIRIKGWNQGTGNCVYHEHDGYRLTFQNFHITGYRGFMCEWNEGGSQPAGANNFIWQDGIIDSTGFENFGPNGPLGTMGFYMDAGTVGGIIRRVTFIGQTRAAVNTFQAASPVTLSNNIYRMGVGCPITYEQHWNSPAISAGRVNIQTAYGGNLANALASNDTMLYVPPGTYNHSTAMNLRSKDVVFDNVTIHGTVGTNAALIISGVSPKVRFVGSCFITRPQWSTTDTYAVEGAGIAIGSYGWPTSNALVIAENLIMDNVWQTGFFVHDTETAIIYGKIQNIGSGRDSFHTTGGSTDIDWNAYLTATDSGDDGAAVVSYFGEPICERVRYRHVTVNGDQLNGRGITCVGGKDCQVDYADIQNTAGAGVYVACEPSFNSHGVDGWTVLAARVRTPNQMAIHDKNCLVYSDVSGRTVTNVNIICDPDPSYPLYGIASGVGTTSNINIVSGVVN